MFYKHVQRALLTISFSLVLSLCGAYAAPVEKVLDEGWSFRMAPGGAYAEKYPKALNWLPATVPGVVQTDLMAQGIIADPYVGLNEADAQWVGLSDWQYKKTLVLDKATLAKAHIDLVFDGLDTFAEVKINGEPVLSADNMFRNWRVAVGGLLRAGENTIEVHFASPIEKMRPFMEQQSYVMLGTYDSAFGDEPLQRNSSAYVRKAGYQYGWDWGPRLVAIGIWKAVKLEAYDNLRLDDFYVAQTHLDDEVAGLEAQFNVWSSGVEKAQAIIEMTAPKGKVTRKKLKAQLLPGINTVRLPLHIKNPQRWYPVGYGKPNLYQVKATVLSKGKKIAQLKKNVGLRTTRIRRTEDQWGRSFEILVNDTPIFMKGANAIPLDLFPSRVGKQQQERVLESAVKANMNMIRFWGGGVYEDRHIYDVADKLGLMIWQDFMFGGAITPPDKAFRENTRQEAIYQVKRLRQHPSIVIWGGNNEVQTNWQNWGSSKRYNEELPLKEYDRLLTGMIRLFDQVLRDAVYTYSPGVPYWAGSPTTDYDSDADMDSDGDRHYWTVWGGKAPVEEYMNVTPRFMSEYGLQAFPVMQTVRAWAEEKDMQIDNKVMRAHQKYDKGRGNQRLLLYITNNYREPKSFEDFVYLTQLMQAEGIELASLHLRASRPQSMGALYWQLNDVWPGASWSSIDYYGRWKALNFRAKRFFAPISASFLRKQGQSQAHIISDATQQKSFSWQVRVLDFSGKVQHTVKGEASVPPLSAHLVAAWSDEQLLQGADPQQSQALFEVFDKSGERVSQSFIYFDATKNLAWQAPQLSYQLLESEQGFTLQLQAEKAAKGVWIDFAAVAADIEDNAFDMHGGERLTLHIETQANKQELLQAMTVRSYFGVSGGRP